MDTALGSTVICKGLSGVCMYGLRPVSGKKPGKKHVCTVTSHGKEERKPIHADNMLCSSAMPESQPTNRIFTYSEMLCVKLVSAQKTSLPIRSRVPKPSVLA